MVRYPVRITHENGNIIVTFPDFPGAHTFAPGEAEALGRAVDALETLLMGLIADREDLPVPRARRGRFVTLPVLTEAKLALYRQMRASRVGKAELARRLRCHPPQIDRLLDLGHASRLDQIEQAFLALGKRLSFSLEDAA